MDRKREVFYLLFINEMNTFPNWIWTSRPFVIFVRIVVAWYAPKCWPPVIYWRKRHWTSLISLILLTHNYQTPMLPISNRTRSTKKMTTKWNEQFSNEEFEIKIKAAKKIKYLKNCDAVRTMRRVANLSMALISNKNIVQKFIFEILIVYCCWTLDSPRLSSIFHVCFIFTQQMATHTWDNMSR